MAEPHPDLQLDTEDPNFEPGTRPLQDNPASSPTTMVPTVRTLHPNCHPARVRHAEPSAWSGSGSMGRRLLCEDGTFGE
ncbi:hypothetical protein LZ30DRAFT_740509 [Colletotrichum cereale]|nr:hypothetical protein LZ30DRAFT_740509 [Colletotrichum cereale]